MAANWRNSWLETWNILEHVLLVLLKRCEQIRSLFCRTTALCVITFGHSPQQCCKGKLVILEAFLFTDRGHVLQSVPVFWRVYTIH